MKDILLDSPEPQALVSTTCAYCGVGCGVDVYLSQDGTPVSLEGTKEHPANYGRLCVKGTHLLDTVSTSDKESGRLHSPKVNGEICSWSDATDTVAEKLSSIIKKHGPDAVAFYVSGQLLTEDYYIANKLMKGYIGSANIDTNSRLCMSSAVAGYKRAFGEDVVPCDYEDLGLTDMLVLVGSNAAWTHPVLFQRVERAKKQRPNLKIVVIDPRKTASVSLANLHLPIKPGSDGAIFNGLLHFIEKNDALDRNFIAKHTEGFESALAEAEQWTIEKTALFCDLPESDLACFYQWFCENQRVITFYSMGINQSGSGVDKCNSIINCHLATGRLLKPGAGPFSITGQPNAMGGREVGGLANQLAAHLDIENPEHREKVQSFWQSPTLCDKQGAKAVDMFDDIASGKIKAVWVMATNPAVSLPNLNAIKDALSKCECVIVSDCVSKNDTIEFADIVLPATGWSEKDGTVTNSERRISRQRGIMKPFGNARHDWDIMCDVATKMGFDGFDFNHQSEVFDEWARMTASVNKDSMQLNLAPLVGLSLQEYNQLSPVQWPFNKNGESVRPFENKRFSTPSGKAKFIAITPRLPKLDTSEAYPFVMNSGRMRDQWHTMTRTGRASALSQHTPFSILQLHSSTASEKNIRNGDIVVAKSEFGEAQAYAQITDSVREDGCFMPIHFNKQFSSSASVSALYSSVADPISGQPESKQVPVSLTKAMYKQYVSVFSNVGISTDAAFWVKALRQNSFHYEMALNDEIFSLHGWSQSQTRDYDSLQGEWISASQGNAQVSILMKDKKLLWASFLFTDREAQQALPADWVNECFEKVLDFSTVTSLLQAKPDDSFLKGRLICSCFKVHEKDIEEAVIAGANTVTALGDTLKCGTNCGSCKSELQQIIDDNIIPVRRVS
ncbi:nitrate reductase [Alteromonas sp. 5E99-2]|uniref:nitrate reductase n=1 Tax=Alteromonas sp. 5E99-2 TaxID=2817683 RepID=UPI00325ADE74